MCRKSCYSSKESAIKGAWEAAKGGLGYIMRAYPCPVCRYWHLTSKEIKRPAVCVFVGDFMFLINVHEKRMVAEVRMCRSVLARKAFYGQDPLIPFIWGFDWFEENMGGDVFNAFNGVASPIFYQLQSMMDKDSEPRREPSRRMSV